MHRAMLDVGITHVRYGRYLCGRPRRGDSRHGPVRCSSSRCLARQ